MEKEKLNQLLRDVGEMVNDEEKVVTYKYVSRTLGIHVNTAKQVLHTYIKEQQALAPCTVSATYLLAGLMKDGSHIVCIVSDGTYNEEHSKFDVITSEHVYSIHKGQANCMQKNFQILYTADVGLDPPIGFPIKCKNIKETTSEFKNGDLNDKPQKLVETKSNNLSKSPQKDRKESNRKPGHISNFFSNQAQRHKVKVEEVIEQKVGTEKIDALTSTEKINVEEITIIEESSKEKKNLENKEIKSKKSVSEKRKRKRIFLNSSESESDEENRDARLCLESAVEENVIGMKIVDDEPEELTSAPCKRRKKKTVDRTILHEDGYMETKKEVVFETDSENESTPTKENNRKTDPENITSDKHALQTTKAKPVQKAASKKQSSLLSFFKKN